MNFSRELRDDVISGDITVSFRLWQRPQVRVGGRVVFAVWALAGLYGALGPALVHALTGSGNVVLGPRGWTTIPVRPQPPAPPPPPCLTLPWPAGCRWTAARFSRPAAATIKDSGPSQGRPSALGEATGKRNGGGGRRTR
jgi:hypothetical protein